MVPMRQMHAHANAPTSSHISLVVIPHTSLILNLTHPRLNTHVRLSTRQPRKIRISQAKSCQHSFARVASRARDKSYISLAPSPELRAALDFDISPRIQSVLAYQSCVFIHRHPGLVFNFTEPSHIIYHLTWIPHPTSNNNITSPTRNTSITSCKMPSSTSTAFNPRQRLSILTNSTLGHDVSAAFKASNLASRSSGINETPAPPPSPIDFSYPSTPAEQRSPCGSDSN
jgi:hypothetical protein